MVNIKPVTLCVELQRIVDRQEIKCRIWLIVSVIFHSLISAPVMWWFAVFLCHMKQWSVYLNVLDCCWDETNHLFFLFHCFLFYFGRFILICHDLHSTSCLCVLPAISFSVTCLLLVSPLLCVFYLICVFPSVSSLFPGRVLSSCLSCACCRRPRGIPVSSRF